MNLNHYSEKIFSPNDMVVNSPQLKSVTNGPKISSASANYTGAEATSVNAADKENSSARPTSISSAFTSSSSANLPFGPISDKTLITLIVGTLDSAARPTTIDEAIVNFNLKCPNLTTNPSLCQLVRNTVQDRLITASNSICRNYKNALKETNAESNNTFGVLSTIFGGLGSMTTAANPARIFSGMSAISTGTRAEINQNMYAMLAVEVITKAIDKSRMEYLKELEDLQKKDTLSYSIARAMADAVVYHDKCSILSGLQEASAAVSQAQNPSIQSVDKLMADLNQSIDLKLGQKTITVKEDNLRVQSICATDDQAYQDMLQAYAINIKLNEYMDLDALWKKSMGACKDALFIGLDSTLSSLLSSFGLASDTNTRTMLANQIASNQLAIKSFKQNLDDTLSGVKTETLKRNANLSKIKQGIADLNIDDLKVQQVSAGTLNGTNAKAALTTAASRASTLLDEISQTKTQLAPPIVKAITAAIELVGTSTAENSASLTAAALALHPALISLTSWTAQ